MFGIKYLLHRGGLWALRQKLHSGYLVQAKNVAQPTNVLGTNIHPLAPNCLPSNSIIKLFKSSDAKKGNLDDRPAFSRYTPEEDKQILEHVKTHGKSSISLKHLAESLDRSYDAVRSRCAKLLSENEYETNTDRKHWDYEEDEKLVNHLLEVKKINPNNVSLLLNVKISDFKDIAPEFQRSTGTVYGHWKQHIVPLLEPHLDDLKTSKSLREDVAKIIEVRHEKKTTLKGYSEKDKKFIIKQVELKGDVPETWVFIAKKLGKKNPANVRNFYYNYILNTPKVKGSFTTKEDEIILRHVNENGSTNKSFRDLAKELGRGSPESVEIRHKKLIASNEFEINTKPKTWELDEDKSLIDHVFNIKEIKAGDASSIENVKQSEFTAVATELKRSSSSCYGRWKFHEMCF